MDWENNHRFSLHQRSILRKVFLYFIFNMLIVPGFTASAISSFYDLVRLNFKESPSQFFRDLFKVDSGDFFIALVVQAGGGAFLSQLNSLALLFKNYLSPVVALRTQQHRQNNEEWTKDDGTMFNYGLFYAQTTVVAAMAFVFQ